MQQTGTKGEQVQPWLGGKGDPLGIMQEIKFNHTNKWDMNNPESVLENEIVSNSTGIIIFTSLFF